MKEMPKVPGLQRRRQTFFVRVRIPEDLKKSYKTKEIVRSLKTRDYDEARNRIHLERTKIQSEFDELRHKIKSSVDTPDMLSTRTTHQLEALALRWFMETEKRNNDN